LKNRLFFRILISYFVVILLVAIILGFLSARQIRLHETQQIEESLLNHARLAALLSLPEMQKQIEHLGQVARARVTVINAGGSVLADSQGDAPHMEAHLNRPEVEEARIRGYGKAIRRSHTLQVDMLYVAVVLRKGEAIQGYVRMARPLHEVENAVDLMYVSLYHAIGFALLPALLIALLYTRKISRPIREMRDYTRAVRQGALPGTLLVDTPDELGQVAEDINYLVTEYREKIRLANEEKGKLESALASMVEGILILDTRNRIESCNRGMESILGYPQTDILGKTLLEAFLNVDLRNSLDRFRRNREPVLQEISLGGKHTRIVDVSVSAIQDLPDGEEKTILVFHDVTQLKKLEQMRTDFVANVTHEIRTPLTAIIGFIQTLLDGAMEDRETARKFLRTIANNAERLSRLVDDLLTLSSIELNEASLNLEALPVDALVRTVLPMVEAAAGEKKIRLSVAAPQPVPNILADRDRATQVLLNVLTNAVKFTPVGGSVTVVSHEDEKGNYVVLKVTDTGIGIPSREIPRLGERFYRVDKTRSRELGGTGLGLSIVKHLMEAHGGEMRIASTLGKGTTVSLFFQRIGEKG